MRNQKIFAQIMAFKRKRQEAKQKALAEITEEQWHEANMRLQKLLESGQLAFRTTRKSFEQYVKDLDAKKWRLGRHF